MFELTNEQRKCFALVSVNDGWERIKIKSSPYDTFETYAYWWLRTPGQYTVEKMYVLDGRFTSSNSLVGGDHFNYLGVRPAMYFQVK